MSRYFLNLKFWLVVIILVAGVTAVRYTADDVPVISQAEKIVRDAIAPLEGGVMKVTQSVNNYVSGIVSFGQIKNENSDLKKKVAKLESEVNRLKEFEYKNIQLRDMLGFKEATTGKFDLVTATVVGRDPNNWLQRITINRGSNDGIAKDMPVVTDQGLVGKVISVSAYNAEVILILDPTGSGVGGLVQVTRTPGVVEGNDDPAYVRMIHLPRDAAIRENQSVITSGLGGIYPEGIPIGRVVKIQPEPNGILKYALLKPYVDFDKLEDVFVIKNAPSQGGQ